MDKNNLEKMIAEKYISVQPHPEAGLLIYNYTQKAQFDRVWNNETLMCRGLITDLDGNIVARPFQKFFNLSEAIDKGEQLPVEDFEVTEKMDGSLGILYWANGKPHIATRGSFVSDQAIKGTKILHKKYADVPFNPMFTYLFEIIYPSNRIVVDYKGIEDLVLLAQIRTESGIEVGIRDYAINMPIVRKYDGITDIHKLSELQEDNKEGFVIRFASGKRYKVKFDEYVRLHRLVTGVNARSIWDLLRNNQPFDELLDRVPDEFNDWVRATKANLEAEFLEYSDSANFIYNMVRSMPSRKDQAKAILESNAFLSGVIFKMLDGKPYDELIWKLLKPKAEKPYKEDL